MVIVRLIYCSEYRIDTAKVPMIHQLNEILSVSNRNNQARAITGALIFDSEWFVQVLEGERDAVWATFKRIENDRRHTNATLIEMVAIEGRVFGNWWMGCAERNGRTAPAFAPYLRQGSFQPANMGASEILSLLTDLTKIGFERELAIAS